MVKIVKIKIDMWTSNKHTRLEHLIEDVIEPCFNVCEKDGITLVRMYTKDKYVEMWESYLLGEGVLINISPILDVEEEEWKHEDFWSLSILLEGAEGDVHITPLKHEYAIAIISRDLLFKHPDDYTTIYLEH